MVDSIELYGSIKCEVCGVPWEDHADSCPNHHMMAARRGKFARLRGSIPPGQMRTLVANGFDPEKTMVLTDSDSAFNGHVRWITLLVAPKP